MKVLSGALLLVTFVGCSSNNNVGPSRASVAAAPDDLFEVTIPTGANWQELQRGPLPNVKDSFVIAVADRPRMFQLTVMVLPSTSAGETLASAKDGWEKGFLKKATRKKSSGPMTLAGHDAHKVTAEVDGPDGAKYEVVSMLVIANNRNFTVSVTKPGKNVLDDPEVQKFIQSFKIKGG